MFPQKVRGMLTLPFSYSPDKAVLSLTWTFLPYNNNNDDNDNNDDDDDNDDFGLGTQASYLTS